MSEYSVINSNKNNTETILCFNYEKHIEIYIEGIKEQTPKENINYNLCHNNEIYLETRQQKTSHNIDKNENREYIRKKKDKGNK